MAVAAEGGDMVAFEFDASITLCEPDGVWFQQAISWCIRDSRGDIQLCEGSLMKRRRAAIQPRATGCCFVFETQEFLHSSALDPNAVLGML